MTNLPGQAFDTEKMYGELGIKQVQEYAVRTGLTDGSKDNLDGETLYQIMKSERYGNKRILEVGCGYGRLGKFFMQRLDIEYYGIELHRPFVKTFKEEVSVEQSKRIFPGNFLDLRFDRKLDFVLFPWSVIGDFSTDDGQIRALEKSRDLLWRTGRILIDIPSDLVNQVQGYQPGYFKIHERYDLSKIDLKFLKSNPYKTFTGRNREILELTKK